MSASIASPRPSTRPTTNYTPNDNERLERWSKEAPTAYAIEAFLVRHTHGWNRTWYATTVSALARELGRSRSQVKTKLNKLVERGLVIKEKLDGGGFRLALAKQESPPKTKPKTEPKTGCGKLSKAPVENSEAPEGGGRKTGQRVAGKPARGGGGFPATLQESNPEDHSGSRPPKQNKQKETQRKSLSKTEPSPAEAVDNSTLERSKRGEVAGKPTTPQEQLAKFQQMHKARIEETHQEPVRVRTLRYFPDREDVPSWKRMDMEKFEKLWRETLGWDRDHTALRSYAWHTLEEGDLAYLIRQCRRARNLYPYARTVVKSIHEGLSGPKA